MTFLNCLTINFWKQCLNHLPWENLRKKRLGKKINNLWEVWAADKLSRKKGCPEQPSTEGSDPDCQNCCWAFVHYCQSWNGARNKEELFYPSTLQICCFVKSLWIGKLQFPPHCLKEGQKKLASTLFKAKWACFKCHFMCLPYWQDWFCGWPQWQQDVDPLSLED